LEGERKNMNTVKRWLAGFLSFAMIFTSAAFSNVGVLAAEVQPDNADAKVKVTIGTTTTYWPTFKQALTEVQSESDFNKQCTIELVQNITVSANNKVSRPVDVKFNGYSITFTGNGDIGPKDPNKVCMQETYAFGALSGYSFRVHNPAKQYVWEPVELDNPQTSGNTMWQVRGCNEVCDNCGITVGALPANVLHFYNANLKQYEFYGSDTASGAALFDDKYLLDTMSAEGYVIVDGSKFDTDGRKIRHDENGKPIPVVKVLKVSDGSEVKDPDVTLSDPTEAEKANNDIYSANGITIDTPAGWYVYPWGDIESTCLWNGRKAYKVVVKDPDGKELETKYILDTDFPRTPHEKGSVKRIELLTGSDINNLFATEGAAREDAALNNLKVEKITKVKVDNDNDGIDETIMYRYWYYLAAPNSGVTFDANGIAIVNPIDIDIASAVAEDGSFTYRPVYNCIYNVNNSFIFTCTAEIFGDAVVVNPLADEANASEYAKNKEALDAGKAALNSTCTRWYYKNFSVKFDYKVIDPNSFDLLNKKATYTYVVKNNGINNVPKPKHTHKSGDVSETTAPSCFAEGIGTGKCIICGTTVNDWPIAKTDNHSHKGGANFTGDISDWTAFMVDHELLESHKLVLNKAGAQWNTLLTVEPTCTEAGGEYLYCENGFSVDTRTGASQSGHWYKTKTLDALGHNLSTVVSVGDGTGPHDSWWSGWESAFPNKNFDYIFFANQKCNREDDMYMTVRYHSVEGEDTDTDKYSAVIITENAAGVDCVTPAKTIYSVPALTDSKTGKTVSIEFVNGGDVSDKHDIQVKKFKWSSNFKKATAIGTCKVCKAENMEAEADVTQATEANGITTFTATYNGATDTKKAFSLVDAVITFDTEAVKDGNVLYSGDTVLNGKASELPDVTVTINGTKIDPDLYVATWAYNNQKKAAIVTVDWTEAVKKSGDAPYVVATKTEAFQVDAKKVFSTVRFERTENDVVQNGSASLTTRFDANKVYGIKATTIPADATVKYAILDKQLTADNNNAMDIQKQIEALDFNLDEVKDIKNAGKYYIYAQITKDDYTTWSQYVGGIVINPYPVTVMIDDAEVTVGQTPELKKQAYDGSKAIDIDWNEVKITTSGGQALDQLDAGIYKLIALSDNYAISTVHGDYVATLTVLPKDEDVVNAEAIANELATATTDDALAAAYAKYAALSDELKKVVESNAAAKANLGKAKAAYDAKQAAEKKAADEKAAGNVINMLATVTDNMSQADAKKIVDAYNALTADQKALVNANATAKANLAKAQSIANKPATKSTPSVKISTKSKTYKAKDLKKKAKSFKIKYSKTSGSGKATFKKSSGSKKLKVSKAGKITVKKGTKKGTYKIKVKLTVAANSKFNAKTVKKTIKVKVK
jgi:hypothetical protein